MRRCDNPAIRDERTTTTKFAREKSTLDKRHLPGMWTEAGRMTTYNTIWARVDLTATCNEL